MKRAKGKELRSVNLNQMIFYVQKYEHMMSSSGLIGFLQILKGWKRKATQDYEQSWGLAGRLRYGDMPKDIAAQMAGILALAQ